MKTTVLIRPPLITSEDVLYAQAEEMIPPIGLAYIASYIRSEEPSLQVKVIDAYGEGIARKNVDENFYVIGLTQKEILDRITEDTLIIGVSCMFSSDWSYLKSLITKIKKKYPQAKLVAGGEHATALPHYLLADCPALDYVICGEGEIPFLELIRSILNGDYLASISAVVGRQTSKDTGLTVSRIQEIDKLPWPA